MRIDREARFRGPAWQSDCTPPFKIIPMTVADRARHRARQLALFPEPAFDARRTRFAARLGQPSQTVRPAVVLCVTCGMKQARYGFQDDEQKDRPGSFCFECFLFELQRRRRRAQIAARRALER